MMNIFKKIKFSNLCLSGFILAMPICSAMPPNCVQQMSVDEIKYIHAKKLSKICSQLESSYKELNLVNLKNILGLLIDLKNELQAYTGGEIKLENIFANAVNDMRLHGSNLNEDQLNLLFQILKDKEIHDKAMSSIVLEISLNPHLTPALAQKMEAEQQDSEISNYKLYCLTKGLKYDANEEAIILSLREIGY